MGASANIHCCIESNCHHQWRGTTHNVTVDGGQSILNITDLMSGVVYTLQVVAVAEDGQKSIPSVAIMAMTLFPCKCTVTMCIAL